MAEQDRRLVLAWFDTEAAARKAVDELTAWEATAPNIVAPAGIFVRDARGHIKRDLLGPQTTASGASIGAILGAIARLPNGDLVGAPFYQELGISQADRERIGTRLQSGQALVASWPTPAMYRR